MRKLIAIVIIVVLLGTAISLLVHHQATVYLMPTPTVLSTGNFDPFKLNRDLVKDNNIRILFATNRLPAKPREDRTYTIFPGNKLRLGIVRMEIGGEEKTWEKILNLSMGEYSGKRPALRMGEIRELADYPLDGDVYTLPATRVLTAMVDRVLDRHIDKDITIYVHGANTGIYRASAQAAQYQHFTGQNSVVLVYFWPSAENLLGYGKDTRHARKSAPAFARLIKLLARHTKARRINILAYSAGAQIVSPALNILGLSTGKLNRKEYRLGQVYFAAADIGVRTFATHLRSYVDMPLNTTLAINLADSVLGLAATRERKSRAGRPNPKDLDPQTLQWIRGISSGKKLTVIEVSSETVSGMRSRSHDFWYTHPWVSSDILTQFLFHKTPAERGLIESAENPDMRHWRFPSDYPRRINRIIKQAVGASTESS